MLKLLIQIIWFFLPAAFANMSPNVFKFIPFLNYPVDFNIRLQNKPLLGKNKTYRGFFFGILIALLTIIIQKTLYPYMSNLSLVNYNQINIYLLGFLLGFGALFGDCFFSFLKRRINIPPGKPWIPFDQINWVIGSLLLTSLYISFSFKEILTSIIFLGFLHPVINLLSYYLGLQKNKM